MNCSLKLYFFLFVDVTVMVLGSGTPGEYSSILLNPSKDFIPLSDTTNENDLKSTAKNVIDRIKTSKFIFLYHDDRFTTNY